MRGTPTRTVPANGWPPLRSTESVGPLIRTDVRSAVTVPRVAASRRPAARSRRHGRERQALEERHRGMTARSRDAIGARVRPVRHDRPPRDPGREEAGATDPPGSRRPSPRDRPVGVSSAGYAGDARTQGGMMDGVLKGWSLRDRLGAPTGAAPPCTAAGAAGDALHGPGRTDAAVTDGLLTKVVQAWRHGTRARDVEASDLLVRRFQSMATPIAPSGNACAMTPYAGPDARARCWRPAAVEGDPARPPRASPRPSRPTLPSGADARAIRRRRRCLHRRPPPRSSM